MIDARMIFMALAAALPGVLAACGTVPIDMRYRPASGARAITGEPRPRLRLEVLDETGGPYSGSIAGDINVQMRLQGPLRAKILRPYEVSLREALELELGRLGFAPAAAGAAAEGTLTAVLRKLVCQADSIGSTNVPMSAVIQIDLSLADGAGTIFWEDEIKGKGRGIESAPAYLRVGAGPNDSVNGALADAMSRLGPLLEYSGVLPRLAGRGGPKDPIPPGPNTSP